MQVYLEDELGFFDANQEILDAVYKVIVLCLEKEEVPYEAEISLTVVEKEEIQRINKEYREIDKVTDVLSFPQVEPSGQGIIEWEELDKMDNMNLDTNQLILGDIILCSERAQEQAKQYGHSLQREICFLVAHSMLHLLGYDHMNEADEKQMIEKQEAILQALNICR